MKKPDPCSKSSGPALAAGALGAAESAVMGIAGTAPAFSVAVTSAAIVSAVGTLAVGSVLYCGLIMFGIMLAFLFLSREQPHAGASYAWVGSVFGPAWGFFAGWAMLVASVFFMASATMPAAASTLMIIAPDKAGDVVWICAAGAFWLTAVTAVVARGIRHASAAQTLLTILESAVIAAILGAAFIRFGPAPAHPPSLDWISPFSFTPGLFASGALSAIFFYWGWDVTMNLSEETGSPGENPRGLHPAGKGALWSMGILIAFFSVMLLAILLALTDSEIAASSTNVLYALAAKLFPEPWSHLAVLSTILSTLGTIETQILQFSRGMFAMARDKALPAALSKTHPAWQTPWAATALIWAGGCLLLAGAAFMPSAKAILEASINAIGVQICFYMALTGYACAWKHRAALARPLGPAALLRVAWPAAAAAFLTFIAAYSLPGFDMLTLSVALGGLAAGALPWLWSRRKNKTAA